MAEREDPDLFDRMVRAGHATFSLAVAADSLTVHEGREIALVKAAVEAGVLGALTVMREDAAKPDEDPEER